jgi:hypothetical protein
MNNGRCSKLLGALKSIGIWRGPNAAASPARTTGHRPPDWVSVNDRLPALGTVCELRGTYGYTWRVTHWRVIVPNPNRD